MIKFRYFGLADCPRKDIGCPCSRKSIWAHFVDEQIDERGYIETKHYTMWGSPNKPIIRSVYSQADLHVKLLEMRKSSKYTKILAADVPKNCPNVISEIGQFLTMKKLKNV